MKALVLFSLMAVTNAFGGYLELTGTCEAKEEYFDTPFGRTLDSEKIAFRVRARGKEFKSETVKFTKFLTHWSVTVVIDQCDTTPEANLALTYKENVGGSQFWRTNSDEIESVKPGDTLSVHQSFQTKSDTFIDVRCSGTVQ